MKYLISGLFNLFLITSINAQQTDRLQAFTSQSEIMGQERTLRVYLPKDYPEQIVYPVMYITDGTSINSDVAASFLDGLSEPNFNLIPQSRLVGILRHIS